jgi:phage terminase large subunit-like protein
MDKVQATCDSARQNPGEENAFRQLRLNQWVKQSIRDISFDRWGAVQNLEGMGFNVVAMGQGFASMFPPTKELMKLTLEQKIAHGGHPVLRWNMYNIFIRTDLAGNIKADKSKSTEKIDGAIACIMA